MYIYWEKKYYCGNLCKQIKDIARAQFSPFVLFKKKKEGKYEQVSFNELKEELKSFLGAYYEHIPPQAFRTIDRLTEDQSI